jgi:GNAT superfamily N-acetyltransferase
MEARIRIAGEADIPTVAAIIRAAFEDVARQFQLTRDNAPTHPSNCEEAWIRRDMPRGVDYHLLTVGDESVGCYGYHKGLSSEASFQRLAVLPSHQQRGLGRMLVQHALRLSRAAGARSVKIGIVAQHRALAEWYVKLGFVEAERRRFEHLPFEVLYLCHSLHQT